MRTRPVDEARIESEAIALKGAKTVNLRKAVALGLAVLAAAVCWPKRDRRRTNGDRGFRVARFFAA